MITRNALYTFIETLIDNSGLDTPLEKAVSFRNLTSSVDEADKVIRVECFDGQHCMTAENVRKELNVKCTIQCWVIPESDDQTDIDAAVDLSFEMSRTIFVAIAANANLAGLVCDISADEFETGEGNLGAVKRGVTYLDGIINQAN